MLWVFFKGFICRERKLIKIGGNVAKLNLHGFIEICTHKLKRFAQTGNLITCLNVKQICFILARGKILICT